MKNRIPAAIAMSFALSLAVAPVAFAETAAPAFRSADAQPFSADDLQRYGLASDDAATVLAYQQDGYTIQLVTPEEAEAYNAGLSNSNILAVVGLVVIVLVVAAAI